MAVLQARLRDKDRNERAAKEAATRKGLIGSGDRSDRIRTYNFPQGRLTDHRINLTLYKLDRVMDGELDDVVEALRAARAAEQLAALECRARERQRVGRGAGRRRARWGWTGSTRSCCWRGALQRPRAWLLAHDEHALSPAQQQRLRGRLPAPRRRRTAGLPAGRARVPRPDAAGRARRAGAAARHRDPGRLGARAAGHAAGQRARGGRPGHRQRRDRAGPEAHATRRPASARSTAARRRWRWRAPTPRASACRSSGMLGDWWQPLAGRRFHLVVSNPPYVADDDPHLAALRHEPALALTPGGDGLSALAADRARRAAAPARRRLAAAGTRPRAGRRGAPPAGRRRLRGGADPRRPGRPAALQRRTPARVALMLVTRHPAEPNVTYQHIPTGLIRA